MSEPARGACWAVIPIKDFVNAKQRLSGVLSPSERRALSQAMAEDMLACLQGASGLGGVLLVSDDPGADLLAYRYGADIIREAGGSCGLNAAIEQAAQWLLAAGASQMLVLHGDLPLINLPDIDTLVASASETGRPFVHMVSDEQGTGTNALHCSLPAPISFSYGENSLAVHQQACQSKGMQPRLLALARLALDIDTPHDLQQLVGLISSECAGKTAAVLQDYGIDKRISTMALDTARDHNDQRRHGNE